MLELRNKKLFTVIIFSATIAIIYWCYKYYGAGIYTLGRGTSGLSLFYTLNGCGNFLPFYIFISFLSNNLVSDNYYKNKETGFQKFIVTRVNPKQRKRTEILSVLLISFIFRIIIHIITILTIYSLTKGLRLDFYGDPSYFPSSFFAFSNNSIISFILYIIYSSIGFSIFSLFLYSLINYTKNYYVYKSLGIIIAIIGVLIPAFIGNIGLNYIDESNPIFTAFLYSIYSAGLISPGIETLNSASGILNLHLYFIISCFGYLLMSTILLKIGYKKEIKNG